MAKLEDLTGKIFGKLTILKRVEDYDGKTDLRAQYLVRCECGKKEKIIARYLKRGDRKSCYTCKPKKAGKKHDGRKAYWGSNADLFKAKEVNNG